ncbi:hypothetical protein [Phytohabitans suffuscus]|nr:hypothetical protein [Phytohabitans suffuscus]
MPAPARGMVVVPASTGPVGAWLAVTTAWRPDSTRWRTAEDEGTS